MYKILTNVEKIEAEVEKKGKKKVKVIDTKENIRLIDLDRRFSGHPIKSHDVVVCASIYRDFKEDGILDSYKGMRGDFLGFMENETLLGNKLTKMIDDSGISRTVIHKKIGCSSETLRKLEDDPLSLNDRCKRYLRRKINEVIKNEKSK